MDKDQELSLWKALADLQGKVDQLELENSRLKAFIDEANAQEPISNVDVYYDSNDSGDRIFTWETFGSNFKSLGVGKHKLYASPIPAQQQQCNSGTNEYGLDIGYMAGKLNLFLRDISRHKPSEAARVLARLALVADDSIFSEPEFAQQSQVATSDKVLFNGSHGHAGYVIEEQQSQAVAISKTENSASSLEAAVPDDWNAQCVCGHRWHAVLPVDNCPSCNPSPRITEQDAREIAQSAVEYYSDHGWRDGDNFWMQNKGLSLLNKLNEAKNG